MKKLSEKYLAVSLATVGLLHSFAGGVFATQKSLFEDGTQFEKPTGFTNDLGSLINGVLSFVMVIAALLVFFYLIWGGIEWITSGGDKGKTESARNKITAAVVGLIILAASYAILTVALQFLGFNDFEDALQYNVLSTEATQ